MQEALAIIAESGPENLSLREVSRRLGVSHQAPYRHFPSRDHILAEVVRRAFDSFAHYLDSHLPTGTPAGDVRAMGRAYLEYARAHPLHYRLMFGTPLPDPSQHPEMMHSAQHAFALLRDGIARLRAEQGTPDERQVALDALFVWSAVHGFATVMQTQALEKLAFSDEMVDAAAQHVLMRIGQALGL